MFVFVVDFSLGECLCKGSDEKLCGIIGMRQDVFVVVSKLGKV